MHVKFWGTRGSLPKSGPGTIRYGGNTSCVEVRSDRGTLVMIDCGSGAHAFGQELMKSGDMPKRGHMLISHTHWDHIQGFPFFAPLFVPGMEWDIYGPQGLGTSFREALSGQMQYTYFPIGLEQLGATIRFHELVEGYFEIDGIVVRARYLNHPALTLSYRLEVDGASVVYACDHEPHSRELACCDQPITGGDLDHAEFLSESDLVIHDAQYTPEEFDQRIGWGHSTADYAARVSKYADVRQLALTHHDPVHVDDDIDRMTSDAKQRVLKPGDNLNVIAAGDGQRIDLPKRLTRSRTIPSGWKRADQVPVLHAEATLIYLGGEADEVVAISDALATDGLKVKVFSDQKELFAVVKKAPPSLLILEYGAHDINVNEICRKVRKSKDAVLKKTPILVVGEKEDSSLYKVGVTGWLLLPFSSEYVRTRISACLLRNARKDKGDGPDNVALAG